jgi:two-component system CheB/CheR fusion protein
LIEQLALWIVGLGASAGGLDALERFLERVPPGTPAAFVVVQHLAPGRPSAMVDLLARATGLVVTVAESGAVARAGHVYVAPPATEVRVHDGALQVVAVQDHSRPSRSVDTLFASLGAAVGERAIAVVLSGAGTDGSRGVWAVKEAGGCVMVQEPGSAAFDGMPRSAVATGLADAVRRPEELADDVVRLVTETPPATEIGGAVRRILHLVRADSGLDFTAYRAEVVQRRIARRMAIRRIESVEAYGELVEAVPDEREALRRELLIGVTRFLRDPDVWEHVRTRCLAPLVERATGREPLRLWVAGCSTGEEAYTLAVLLDEEMERCDRPSAVKIIATDVDRHALERAGRGRYPASAVAHLGAERVERYFVRHGDEVEVDPALRRRILFAEHDVTRDPPFTRVDLVTCRNLLIYLAPEVQQRVVRSFHQALVPGGMLVLGTSETVPGRSVGGFGAVDPDRRIYRSLGGSVDGPAAVRRQPAEVVTPAASAATTQLVLETLVAQYAPVAVLIDERFRVRVAIGPVEDLLGASVAVGDDLRSLCPPGVADVLALGVPRASRSDHAAVHRRVAGHAEPLTVRFRPLREPGTRDRLVLVVLERDPAPDQSNAAAVTEHDGAGVFAAIRDELERERRRNTALRDELERVNEELEASNEELFASNAELLSVNQELRSVNADHEDKIAELEALGADLDHLVRVTDIGAVFLDEALTVRRVSVPVSDVVPLREADVGRPIAELAGRLGGGAFLAEVYGVRAGGPPIERSIDTAGGPLLVRIQPFGPRPGSGVVVTFIDVTVVQRTFELARRTLDTLPAHVAFVAPDGTIRMTNRSWNAFSDDNGGDLAATGTGANYFAACAGDPTGELVSDGIRRVLSGELDRYAVEYPCDGPTDQRWFLVECSPDGDGNAVVVHVDISRQKRAELDLQRLATTDPLTGLLNRRGLERHLITELDRVRRSGSPLSVLMIDCDDFKRINDQLGHGTGDAVLATVARRLQAAMRPEDVVARVGGDEFVALLPGADLGVAGGIAERLRLGVAALPVMTSYADLHVTVSVAVSALEPELRTFEDLVSRVRFALRHAKADGKNRVSVAESATPTVAAPGIGRLLLSTLADPDGVTVLAQPIVDLATGRPVAVELLSRCIHPPFLDIGTLFQAAMEEGLLGPFDERCLHQCVEVFDRIPRELACHVNVFPSTLLHLGDDVLDGLFRRARGRSVQLELSEQQILGDPAYLLPRVRRLRAAGVGIAIDDVGFGRTSLETLIMLEPDVVKLDRAVVHRVGDDADRRRWLERLVSLSTSLGAEVVAEGVERIEDAAVLAGLGVTRAQGMLFGAPVRPDDLVGGPGPFRR